MFHPCIISVTLRVMNVEAPLLAAAERTFAQLGYGAATMERIAREAGLSRVTLHRRGVTKERLLAALTAVATEEYRAAMWPMLTGAEPAAERLRRALEVLCREAERHMGLLLALRAQTDAVFHEDDDEALTRNVFTEPLERLLRDGIADGSVCADDPVEMATVLFNMAGWTYIHLRTGHGWPPERALRAVLEPIWHGLSCSREVSGGR